MPKRIPIRALSEFCQQQGLEQAVLFGYDGDLQHVVTWGSSVENCASAADFGNRLKAVLDWPEHTKCEPSRVKTLQKKLETAYQRIAELQEKLLLYYEEQTPSPSSPSE